MAALKRNLGGQTVADEMGRCASVRPSQPSNPARKKFKNGWARWVLKHCPAKCLILMARGWHIARKSLRQAIGSIARRDLVKLDSLNSREESLPATETGPDGQEGFLLAIETVPLPAGRGAVLFSLHLVRKGGKGGFVCPPLGIRFSLEKQDSEGRASKPALPEGRVRLHAPFGGAWAWACGEGGGNQAISVLGWLANPPAPPGGAGASARPSEGCFLEKTGFREIPRGVGVGVRGGGGSAFININARSGGAAGIEMDDQCLDVYQGPESTIQCDLVGVDPAGLYFF
ncbi:uncharacterized protein PGTG_10875 [Puccinia graminis f. sp. tritici CRL 75-36-700-3]|uniref:Uncharacterized protein n=1 Tax=Puccinia graminis f. sp. tritici (strain CRL 75-36-700-3 / race SCCL) TaxID=418459 RepID=E3KK91_PUCGT|nr:uncharacterized protein PGTG_10875 [Puccinia graminis f. sp. tritici CRL 75-36-700-3]EFP84716.2 hypothetical protein PGTG_10875 [Puccinia graminis f. sp. tritici CRL 75-36-700-3]